jgi:Zn-dependent M28 family amino/carboxypeptidase
METLRVLKTQGLVPRRTLRAVLFANEENGLRGGRAYAADHAAELPRHVAALESDAGAGRPLGVALKAGPGDAAFVEAIARLQPFGATRVIDRAGGADIGQMAQGRVPQLGLLLDAEHYFDWHHTPADTFDKIEPEALAQAAAYFATLAYVLAEDERLLGRPEPPPPAEER